MTWTTREQLDHAIQGAADALRVLQTRREEMSVDAKEATDLIDSIAGLGPALTEYAAAKDALMTAHQRHPVPLNECTEDERAEWSELCRRQSIAESALEKIARGYVALKNEEVQS